MSTYNEIARRRPDLVEALFMPYPTDRRGEVPAGLNPWFDMPIFSWYQGELTCVYIRPYIESAQSNFPEAPRLTQKQIEVMNLLDEIIAEGKNFRAFALIRYPIGDANKIVADQVKKSKVLDTKLKASKAFQDLEQEIEAARKR
jgi:hypothetical protein